MIQLLVIALLSGAYPLLCAWRASRGTSLVHAVAWTGLAWLGGLAAWWRWSGGNAAAERYAALCLACCPGIAVLGARRPHVAAWNLVVLGMLAVMLWPLVEGALLGRQTVGAINLVFQAGVLLVGVVNYLPTRLAPAVVLAGVAGAAALLSLAAAATGETAALLMWVAGACLAATPWAAYFSWLDRHRAAPFDRLWLSFRDRYGLAWGQRVRDQFNRAAANAGWQAQLSWQGLRMLSGTRPDDGVERDMLDLLTSLLQRFCT